MVKILVTGGSGFIGGHICRRLVEGGYDVVCLDNFDPYYDPGLKMGNVRELIDKENFELVEGDVGDLNLLKKLCEDIDYVYHEAAQAGVRTSVENPLKPYGVNIEGTLNVLKAVLDSDVKKVVNASSSSVYGKVQYLPFDEGHPKNPMSPYGVSKLAGEQYCRVFSEVYGIKTVNLRYFTVYGPRMRPDLAISIFTRLALNNKLIEIFGDGHKTRDFTHVDDIVDANLILMKRGVGTYNIGSGNRISVNELATRIIRLTDSKSKISHTTPKRGDVEHTCANVSKIKKELGWRPRVGIDEGLKGYVDWVRASLCG